MRLLFTISFLFVFGVVSAQDKKKVKDTTTLYHYKTRLYIIQPCYRPSDGTIRINSKEYDPNNHYRYTDQKPIVLKPGDNAWLEEMLLKGIVVEKNTVPVL